MKSIAKLECLAVLGRHTALLVKKFVRRLEDGMIRLSPTTNVLLKCIGDSHTQI